MCVLCSTSSTRQFAYSLDTKPTRFHVDRWENVECGQVTTCKMQGAGFTPQFTCMNTPRPHHHHEAGDIWAWDNTCYIMKRQLWFKEVHKVKRSRSAKRHVFTFVWNITDKELTVDMCKDEFQICVRLDRWHDEGLAIPDGYHWSQNR